jgi:hypothetical protein
MYSLEEKNGKKKSWKKTKFSPPVFILSPAQRSSSHRLTFYTHEGLFGICLSELRPAASDHSPLSLSASPLQIYADTSTAEAATWPRTLDLHLLGPCAPPVHGPMPPRALPDQPYISERRPDPPMSRALHGRDGMVSDFLSTTSNRRLTPPWRRHGA